MPIRSYQPGDEIAQARVYNAAAATLPGFKPGTADEISRRYRAAEPDPLSRFYAVENGEVVGYAVFTANGRISCPWCLPGHESLRTALLEAVIAEMSRRGLAEAWAAYRADWLPVLECLADRGFAAKRAMINYVAEAATLRVDDHLGPERSIEPLSRDELPSLLALDPDLFAGVNPRAFERFYWEHPHYRFAGHLVALRDASTGAIRGARTLVVDDSFADPTKIDASMPCYRLGAFGTEGQRHKRINGLFSCIYADEIEADTLLARALAPAADRPPLTFVAAQAPSDAAALCAWYDRHFHRQGAFPIMARALETSEPIRTP